MTTSKPEQHPQGQSWIKRARAAPTNQSSFKQGQSGSNQGQSGYIRVRVAPSKPEWLHPGESWIISLELLHLDQRWSEWLYINEPEWHHPDENY